MTNVNENLKQSADETRARLSQRESVIKPFRSNLNVSFEFFPPATDKMAETLWTSIKQLTPLQPSFVSVTYGAGGSTRERTHQTVKRIVDETPLTPAAHLTCVDATRSEINEIADEYWNAGVRHIVALRGDVQNSNPGDPGGETIYKPHPEGYINAADLVAGLKRRHDFDISVAAYPEAHPDSGSIEADIENLKRKVDAGANRAITQFFFDIDDYLRFRDSVAAAGVNTPIVPGILPVTNFSKLKEFAARCGARVPNWIGDLFEGLDEAPDVRALVAATVTAELCTRLKEHGVTDFHFYTLNRAELTTAICRIIGVFPQTATTKQQHAANA